MFLKKVARRSFSRKKDLRRKKSGADAPPCPPIVEPIYYEEPDANSAVSSEVEYIEDDADYVESVDGARIARLKPGEAEAHAKDDDLLALNVCVPSKCARNDDDSCLSQEGILSKLPPNLVDKSRRLSAKVDGSTTSEEHLTQVTETTSAETCSTSMASEKQEDKERKRLETWRQHMEQQIDDCESNPKSAAMLLDLGTMYLQREDFEKAREYFARAVTVSEAVFDMPDLRIARALELYGIVQSAHTATNNNNKEQLECALSSLDTALAIRYELQGPQHIDTVETLSRIARVQLRQRKYHQARDSYYEVLKLREAIFGSFHPCVAITSRALAIAHTRLFQENAAKFYFQAALHIYERNGLGSSGFAAVVRKDLNELKRMKLRCEV